LPTFRLIVVTYFQCQAVQEDSKYILLGQLDPEDVDNTVRRNVRNYFFNDTA